MAIIMEMPDIETASGLMKSVVGSGIWEDMMMFPEFDLDKGLKSNKCCKVCVQGTWRGIRRVTMSTMYKKSFSDADEIKTPSKAHVSVVKLGDMNASKLILEPGWKWSECIKPVVGGDSCQAGHVGVITQGKAYVRP